MSRMEIGTRFRGSSSGACPRIGGAREYFYFKRFRIRVKFQKTSQILDTSFSREYLPKARKNDYDFLKAIIGKDLALEVLKVDEFKARLIRKKCTHFALYFGANKQGKWVALLEVF